MNSVGEVADLVVTIATVELQKVCVIQDAAGSTVVLGPASIGMTLLRHYRDPIRSCQVEQKLGPTHGCVVLSRTLHLNDDTQDLSFTCMLGGSCRY